MLNAGIKFSVEVCDEVFNEGWKCSDAYEGFNENIENIRERTEEAVNLLLQDIKYLEGRVDNMTAMYDKDVLKILKKVKNLLDNS